MADLTAIVGLAAIASTRLFRGRAFCYNLIYKAESFRLFRRHEVVPVERSFNNLVGLAGMLYVNFVEAALGPKDILGMALNVACLSLEAGRGLMHHDARIRKNPPHPRFPSS